MPDSTTLTVQHTDLDHYLKQEIATVQAIYTRLFPDRQLRFVFYTGESPVWGAPSVVHEDVVLQPQHLSPDFIGELALPAPHPGAGISTIFVSIPRRPNPVEIRQEEAPWMPRSRALSFLFGTFPGVYEWIRYRAEIRRRGRSFQRHSWTPLPRGTARAAFLPAPSPSDTAQRPAILIGFHWLEVGGAEKMAFDTVKWALAAGLRVIVVASVPALQRLSDRLPDHPDISFIRLDRYLPEPLWPQYVERLVRAENIRLIHLHHCVPLYASLAHLRARAPWVQVIDTTHIVEYADGGYPRISGVWSNYIDIHHVISRELVDLYRDRFHQLQKVRLGRMLTRGTPEVSLPAIRMTPGQKTLRVAFVGRYYYQKRPVVMALTLRRLAAWARANGVEFRATLVGEGPFRQAVEQILRRAGMGDAVELLPAGTDVPALLRRSDILLLPSNNEGLALVCYEAIEQGCIPISTDVGSQKEIVPPGLLVPLAPQAAVRGTVACVDRLWRDPAFLSAQAQALQDCYRRLAADPTAEEVLMPLYQAVAAGQMI